MYKKLIVQKKPEFDKFLNHFHTELSTLRTGRANTAIVENVSVDLYGTANPIKNIASISVADAKTIVIQPWDKNALSPIEKSIQSANLGLNPVNDGQRIRITLPALNEERRLELVRELKQLAENTRVRVRNIREEIWRDVGKMLKNKVITEDQKYEAQEELKKLMDEYHEKIREISDKKEKEIMTI